MEYLFKRIVLFITGLIAALMVLSNVYAETLLDAKTILERCEKEGAATIIDELSLGEDWEKWFNVTDNIATGDETWIKVSTCLMLGRYESRSEIAGATIKTAWGEALTKNPAAILEVEYQGTDIENTCRLPFYEVEENELTKYVAETLAALETVKQPHLQEGKERCMRSIKEVYKNPDRCKFIDDDWHCPASFCRKDPKNIYCQR